jgi:cyclohexyl-isocyanide hydratase
MSMDGPALQVGFVLYPRLTQLDLTAPWELFARLPDVRVHLAWKDLGPVVSDTGLAMLPSVTFAECPDLDLVCVPGGPGVNALLDDAEVLDFVRRQGLGARYVTSVCSGALVLGAAGLLRGYRATTHWASLDFLAAFGATAERTRVCVDRNRITGGGVTAGLDFGLHLAAELGGRATAERIQLYIEYDPAPPFQAGSPDTAPPDVLRVYRELAAPMLEERSRAVARAAARLD